MSKRILVLLPSTDTIGHIKKKTGWYAEELAEPATLLANREFELVYASPKGGKAPLDEGSREAAAKNGIVKAFLDDKEIQDKIAHTHKIAEFIGHEDSFQGLFVPGGHGAYDLEHNKDSITIIQNFWEKGKVVGGICHGVVAFNEVKLKDGTTPLVKGKKVTGFSDAEEELVGLTKDVTMITASGNQIYASETVNSDIYHAAICSMGALGIITRVTLQCEPAFRLESVQEPGKLSDVLGKMDEIIHSAEHVRLWWYPYTNNVMIWRANRTTKAIQQPAPSWRSSHWFSFHVYQAMLYVTRFVPSLIPALSHFMFWATQSKKIERIDTSVKTFNIDCLFPQYTTEWAIPWSKTSDALMALEHYIERDQGSEEPRVRVHSPVEIRFVKKDKIWLSPAYGVNTCYIGLIMYRPFGAPVPYKRLWTGFERIMSSLGGRPHWAKAHSVTYDELRDSYPKMDQFTLLRKELDPSGMFMNNYLIRHLEPSC
ncbi:hypothetical protein DFQ27_003903 [Actinomortierella ambigua]|uniref:D-arabinono-1,4-lactone oxidase n=1 Tax=Actinomortierella ambigua TaxID=1343610 RepID=A0A9P6Q3E3_9FUNG|nr:hypothetical protein DFQ27_003903 [Actinomortierella ambigua]